MNLHTQEPETINVVICDDSVTNVLIIAEILKSIDMELNVTKITDPRKVMNELDSQVTLLILDLEMPYFTGYEILEKIRTLYSPEKLPVIVVSGLSDQKSQIKALKSGANDFICKPFNEYELKLRVINQLNIMNAFKLQSRLNHELEKRVQLRTFELEQATECLVNKLAMVAEMHDENTGQHILRVGKYSGVLARKLGLTELVSYMIEKAAPMHDMGKIMIPDEILFKPGKLSESEHLVMKQHVVKANDLFDDHPSMMIQMAKSIAVYHHEKWDGSGYAKGLKGHSIPIEGQIVGLVDVFDALTTERPYKHAWTIEDSVQYLKDQSGSHFDPKLVNLFVEHLPEILEIKAAFPEKAL
ncbi:response regulator receiver modulated metal dependent phosphohydrolase [Shewanella sediminis HAW-EB3]|uniref:Response regulator receiver modulated metal dependent phosphohydrolase n=1 Tax=Shewanella sediminis (strain HAW-EB3) TaxID=425104 RepID=A8G096_SHESH|nr:HD domain-containing phosphohydrolase [Shewanella sediminis]ABV38519.1 response regulator receiver modulated metal dependent phosphohydrolase [Shewanella sediminis HAW-EB3]